ncbi:protein-disulfide reductase [Ranunculus cassubicifolius]
MLRLLDAVESRSQASIDVVESESEVVRPPKYPRLSEYQVLRPPKYPQPSESQASMDVESEEIDNFVVGSKVDLVTLLSSRERDYLVDGKGKKVKVSTLKGNYVMIYCFPIPLPHSSRKHIYFALKSALSVWQKDKEIKFKLVVVAKMSPGSGWDAFNNFLSDLPSCLAIPISDSVSCDRLCASIEPYGLILDKYQRVLCFDGCIFLNYFVHESYPFTEDHIKSLWDKLVESIEKLPVHLENLLGLDLNDRLQNAEGNTITVSQLKTKLVGLYMFVNGSFANRINQIFQNCITLHPALEIVVVHVPLGKDHQACVERSAAALKKMGISSWWISPFQDTDTASRKLWLLCGGYETVSLLTDSFIIVGPSGEYLESKGSAVCLALPYPYGVEDFARKETEKLKELSRDTFLAECFTAANPGRPMDLQKKNVILFIGNCDDSHFNYTLEMMKIWCDRNKCCEESNIKFVFVPLHASKEDFSLPKMSWLTDSAMSWLTCRPESEIEKKIIDLTTLRHLACRDVLSFIAFGVEGRIVSIAHPALTSSYYEANARNGFPLLKRTDDGNLPDQLYEDVLDAVQDLVADYY